MVTIRGWFSKGWESFRRTPKPLIGGSVIMAVFSLATNLIGKSPPANTFRLFVIYIIAPVMGIGWLFLCLKVVRGDKARTVDIFSAFSRFITAWVTSFFLALITIAGSILFIIPGVILGLKYGLSLFAVMDRRLSARNALRFSGKITKGYKGKLFWLLFFSFLFNIPAIPFTIGLLYFHSRYGVVWLVAGIIPYVISVVVLTPWLGASYASAYDEISALMMPSDVASTQETPQSEI